MDNYFNYFSRSLENSEFIRLTYQAFGIFVAIILLFLFARFLKVTITGRIRKIGNITMDFKDLKQMRLTGLISDDEYEKMRSGLVKRFTQTPSTESSTSEVNLTGIPPMMERPDEKLKQTYALSPQSPQTSQKSSQPTNIDDLLKRGLISNEEYQKLSEIDHERKR